MASVGGTLVADPSCTAAGHIVAGTMTGRNDPSEKDL